MATRAVIPVEVYLTSVYRPDCDYVDGEVLERTLGDREHSYVQMALGSYFFARRKALGIEVYPEQRVQVKPRRYRIPDICVVVGGKEKIFTQPPFLCIEILSPEDRMTRVWERLRDYFEMGVPNVWVVDPENRVAHIASPSGDLRRVTEVLRTENPALEVPLAEIFE
ncbi:MAG TPA: Uma2 family endonuclease [Bryobacteraceae bacterium]|nr:Uma2 family endonuclease [Bryobacteraceae bacterium]